jgi:CHAD domain-containing protein
MKAKGQDRPAARLSPGMPAVVALHALLDAQHLELDRLAGRLLMKRTAVETVHDFRTVLRRCLGLYRIFRHHLAVSDQQMEARLKSLARAMAPLRDWDVWIELLHDETLHSILLSHPSGALFLQDQRRERRRLAAEAMARVRRILTPAFRQRLRTPWRPPVRSRRAQTPIARLGTRQLARMADKLRRQPEDIVRVDIERMHDVRKALRKIRHLAELLETALPPAGQKLGRAARKGERPLGQVRDIDLALARLRARGDALARRLTLKLHRRRAERLSRGQRAWTKFLRKGWSKRLADASP